MRGGRVASDALRKSQALCEEFAGVEEGFNRYELLLLVKRAGKHVGFTPRMICLLDYYFAYVRDSDFEEGGLPIVYQSVTKTALDMGVSERQIQKLESALFSIGAIGFQDSGNHKRFGQRCSETGRVVYAFGIDLRPLLYLREELEAKLQQKRLYDEAWLSTKREISMKRREIRALLAEWERDEEASYDLMRTFALRYDQIAIQIRTHLSLEKLRALLVGHESLCSQIRDRMGVMPSGIKQVAQQASVPKRTSIGSTKHATKFVHYNDTNQELIKPCSRKDVGFQKSVVEPTEPNNQASSSVLDHVSLSMVVEAASERFAMFLSHDPDWRDVVEAAYRLRGEMDVSQASWGEACRVLGRNGAAVCLLVTDRAISREADPVRNPPAYFRGLVRRAEEGRLRLHSTLFGLLAC